MDEQKLLDKIIELTRENERLKLKLEQYEGKCTNKKQYTKKELRDMIFSEEDKEEIVNEFTELWNDDNFWKI